MILKDWQFTPFEVPSWKEYGEIGPTLMTPYSYQLRAMRTLAPEATITHAILGLAGEAGECADLLKKTYQGHELDGDKLKEEIGDLQWHIAEVCHFMGWNLSDVMARNLEKLQARYIDGFSEDRSLNRNE